MKNRTRIVLIGALMGALGLAGCSSTSSVSNDANATDAQMQRYQANQPYGQFDWSQQRATAIDVLNAKVHGMTTTTFFMNMGVPDPIDTCPSIGMPLPSTAQLTNPDQIAWNSNNSNTANGVVGQAEPDGVYTGDSTGTYVVCVAPNGTKYIKYWEGFVDVIGAPAHWDRTTHSEVLDGDATIPVTVAKGK